VGSAQEFCKSWSGTEESLSLSLKWKPIVG
jgi:hypothetical protein